MSLRIFPAKVENLRSQPGCLQRYLSGPLHVNVSSPRGAAGLCNNAVVCGNRTLVDFYGRCHVKAGTRRTKAESADTGKDINYARDRLSWHRLRYVLKVIEF
ncbi:hypothetical protein [Ralstonia pseudosolanacearum]|uniref:hypothetical protein n=1 Tax=Ralstonia pseudosolanacearum TaxID=1310165 RepID=UPI003F78F69C